MRPLIFFSESFGKLSVNAERDPINRCRDINGVVRIVFYFFRFSLLFSSITLSHVMAWANKKQIDNNNNKKQKKLTASNNHEMNAIILRYRRF